MQDLISCISQSRSQFPAEVPLGIGDDEALAGTEQIRLDVIAGLARSRRPDDEIIVVVPCLECIVRDVLTLGENAFRVIPQ